MSEAGHRHRHRHKAHHGDKKSVEDSVGAEATIASHRIASCNAGLRGPLQTAVSSVGCVIHSLVCLEGRGVGRGGGIRTRTRTRTGTGRTDVYTQACGTVVWAVGKLRGSVAVGVW